MVAMTTTTSTKLDRSVSDVDTNMMGIKSLDLYVLLNTVVAKGDVTVLNESRPDKVLPELIQHLTSTIPEDIFRSTESLNKEQFGTMKTKLSELGVYLTKNFVEKGKYPFTIRRICELCYDPFKYYKVHELKKFVSAIKKCCLVTTCWDFCAEAEEHETGRSENASARNYNGEEVSLTRIPWIDEATEKVLVPFMKEIDNVMNVNFGFEDEEDDEDMDVDVNDFNNGRNGNQNDNFIVEEYYEELPGGENHDEDDDDDDEDEDYIEGFPSDDNDPEDEEEDDDEDEVDGADDDCINDDKNTSGIEKEQVTKKAEPTHNDGCGIIRTTDDKKAPFKRKTTELDDFEYKDTPSLGNHELTTPKKVKHDLQHDLIVSPEVMQVSNDDNDTPIHSQEEEIQSQQRTEKHTQLPSLEQQVSILRSPLENDNEHSLKGEKIRGITDAKYERDIGSPLSNKTR